MNKRMLFAIIAVFLAWSALDFVIHGILLQPTYEATSQLWRPMAEMKMTLMYGVTFMFSAFFVCIYGCMIADKSVGTGFKYGLAFGLAMGVSMGFGSYSYMPIPLMLAWSWFAGTLVQSIVAGVVVGKIIKS